MNIAFGKFGRSINFNENNWGAIGGDNEPPSLFLKLAELNPNNTYYLIGKSNFRRMHDNFKNKYKNIIDLWEFYDKEKDNNISFVYDYTKKNNINIDFGIFFAGPTSNSCLPNLLKNKKGDYCKPLNCFLNYAGPIVDYLNKSNIKYISLVPDSRYNPIPAKDLYNRPVFNLSQYNEENECEHILNYNDLTLIKDKEITTYNDIEKVFFIGKSKNDFSTHKTKKIMIVLNEGGNGGLKRGPMLKEYVLDNFVDVDIYGKWSDEWYKDSRFKGPKKFIELQKMLPEVKYTFIIPIQIGWATAKFWEMINYGIIPFMHPYYDQQKHIKCPDFLRVNSPDELMERIEYLENNEEEYEKLLNELYNMLKDEYYDGTYLNSIINDKCEEMLRR